MTKEEFLQKIKEIGSKEKVEDIRTELTDLSKQVEIDYDNHETTRQEKDKLTNDNENLRKANMKLFLQVGSDEGKEKGKEKEEKDPESKKLEFKDLFNEKGGLK